MYRALEGYLRAWFTKWHGEPTADHQPDFYRCRGCRRLITWNIIRKGGCGCGVNKLSPTNPTVWEVVKVMVLPWMVK